MFGPQSLNHYDNISGFVESNQRVQAWTPSSWKTFVANQQPVYDDLNEFNNCLAILANKSALVDYHEILNLKTQIALASCGEQFLLQAGDCVERFSDCNETVVLNKLSLIFKLKKLIENNIKKNVIPIGRIAGQFAKPRTLGLETQGLMSLPSFKGDIIHSSSFTSAARKTNPQNMLTAYDMARLALSYIKNSDYKFNFYTSHEALLLCYESALTRICQNKYYNTSAHMLWLGERTRSLNEAHVEYLRGIQNPIGIKFSHKILSHELINLVYLLNPDQENGKIILIPRLGSQHVEEHLPHFIHTINEARLNVAWMCDPMHGNGIISENGIKTRKFEDISFELIHSIQIHKKNKSILAGVHLEIASQDVTECLGGHCDIKSQNLSENYQTACDPRLNPSQSIELSKLFSEEMSV